MLRTVTGAYLLHSHSLTLNTLSTTLQAVSEPKGLRLSDAL